jgi:NitT/TauT family transport system ATP-binding protein
MTVASTFAKRRRAAHGAREGADAAVRAAQIELTARWSGRQGAASRPTLTMIAGLDHPSGGPVHVGGQAVNRITTGTSFMFQIDALLPWKTVLGNVALGPAFHGVPKKEAQSQARLGAQGRSGRFRRPSPPSALGRDAQAGQPGGRPDQRAFDLADGRAFGALDVQTKAIMSNELLGLWKQTRPSVVFVTHDLEEAIALADQVVVERAYSRTASATKPEGAGS